MLVSKLINILYLTNWKEEEALKDLCLKLAKERFSLIVKGAG